MEIKHVLINGGGEEDGANWRDFYDNKEPVRRAPRQESFSIVIRAIHFGWMRPGGGSLVERILESTLAE
ncbi:hypothetical protein SFC43_25305 [Bacteroides sp. CR5/BHMF/2]|nr:hypothetical protein [Bacteroides sp. CR5/BHMF/2]